MRHFLVSFFVIIENRAKHNKINALKFPAPQCKLLTHVAVSPTKKCHGIKNVLENIAHFLTLSGLKFQRRQKMKMENN